MEGRYGLRMAGGAWIFGYLIDRYQDHLPEGEKTLVATG
jgi:hypothetical protein